MESEVESAEVPHNSLSIRDEAEEPQVSRSDRSSYAEAAQNDISVGSDGECGMPPPNDPFYTLKTDISSG